MPRGLQTLRPQDLMWLATTLAAEPAFYIQARHYFDIFASGAVDEHTGRFLGWYSPAGIVSAYWVGASVIPVSGSASGNAALAGYLSAIRRYPCSIVGSAADVLDIYRRMTWGIPRGIRPSQICMAHGQLPQSLKPLPVVRAKREHEEEVFAASVAMFTEEVGFSPVESGQAGYRLRVRELIDSGRTFIALDDRQRIVFKADIGVECLQGVQIQGVWTEPECRSQGIATRAMAGVVGELKASGIRTVGLYANDYNAAAVRAYSTIGFAEVGRFATVMY